MKYELKSISWRALRRNRNLTDINDKRTDRQSYLQSFLGACFDLSNSFKLGGLGPHAQVERNPAGPGPDGGRVGHAHVQVLPVVRRVGVPGRRAHHPARHAHPVENGDVDDGGCVLKKRETFFIIFMLKVSLI